MPSLKIIPLVTLLTLSSQSLSAAHALGSVNKIQGEVRVSTKKGNRPVKDKETFKLGRTYSVPRRSLLQAQLLPGTFMRWDPETEFSIDLNRSRKEINLDLKHGSFKALFSRHLNKFEVETLVITTAGKKFIARDAKFTLEKDEDKKIAAAYVEKGFLRVLMGTEEKVVEAGEKIWIPDELQKLPDPQKMKDPELQFIQSSGYLKKALE